MSSLLASGLGESITDLLAEIQLRYVGEITTARCVARKGKINQFIGLVAESNGPQAFLGERCLVRTGASMDVEAEVVGIKNSRVLLMPFGNMRGIQLGSEVFATGETMDVLVGQSLIGRVVDAFGKALDEGPPLELVDRRRLYSDPINPLNRPQISQIIETGIKSIDGLLTVAKGQRIGIFAGSGVGKSSLLGMINRNIASDINVVALIGERGREVKEFVESISGQRSLEKTIVIVATSDQPALVRTHAAWAATAIAEYFSDLGNNVVLTLDSLTRFAMAQREIGLATGEPPTARGYTPSVFALLPKLLERCGTNLSGGSITAFYTVLVEGDDFNDPLSDSIRAILDGGFVLSRDLANERHFPAIDILQSNSRLFNQLVPQSEQFTANLFFEIFSLYEKSKDLIALGAYQKGSDVQLDRAISIYPKLKCWLKQDLFSCQTRADTMVELKGLVR